MQSNVSILQVPLEKNPYPIYIGMDCSKDLPSYISEHLTAAAAVIVTDDIVAALYLNSIQNALVAHGIKIYTYVFPHGEASKSQTVLFDLLEFLAAHDINRNDALIALGGGVVGDLAGFAASIYKRGMPYIQLPTTLLSAIDSSVGGKTAINLPIGKNLIGSFYQPKFVLCDTAMFASLPTEELQSGIGELIKYAVLADTFPLERLTKCTLENILEDITPFIIAALQVKIDYVLKDEKDENVRQFLNLGHTIGHAVEQASGYTTKHGIAVGIGLAYMARASYHLGYGSEAFTASLLSLLEQFSLPMTCTYPTDTLHATARKDKKKKGNKTTIVMPYQFGACALNEVDDDALRALIEVGAK
jgi:3-dehydroquinate synthase